MSSTELIDKSVNNTSELPSFEEPSSGKDVFNENNLSQINNDIDKKDKSPEESKCNTISKNITNLSKNQFISNEKFSIVNGCIDFSNNGSSGKSVKLWITET